MNAGQVRFLKYVALDVVGYSQRSAERMAAIVAAINELVLAVLQEEQLTEDDWLSSTGFRRGNEWPQREAQGPGRRQSFHLVVGAYSRLRDPPRKVAGGGRTKHSGQ